MRDLTLSMLARGESSPYVRGLDVSPIVLVPAGERQKRSIFSPPTKSTLAMSPRRLFEDGSQGDSIQSRLDQPGWDTALGSPDDLQDYLEAETAKFSALLKDDLLADFGNPCTPNRLERNQLFAFSPLCAGQQYTPHTKMFIDGIVGPESSPAAPSGPDSDSRSKVSTSSSPQAAPPTPSPLLPAFAALISAEKRQSTPSPSSGEDSRPSTENRMEVDETRSGVPVLGSPAKLTGGGLVQWRDIFNIPARTPSRADAHSSSRGSVISAGLSRSGTSDSSSGSHARRMSSPTRAGNRHRPRSASSAAASAAASGSRKTLMDRVLDNKTSARRKHTSSQPRTDGDVGVTAMGSPFKLGRKTSRQEFMYSLDGDCEMQDAQPRKRRKTVSGRD